MKKIIHSARVSLGFKPEEVAAAAGWSRHRQQEIEQSDDPFTHELDRLTELLGVNLEAMLLDGLTDPHPVAALLKANAATLPAHARFSISEAMSVAREARALERSLGYQHPMARLDEFKGNTTYTHPRDGAPERLALATRKKLRLGEEPIVSMGKLLDDLGVLVLWDRLPSDIDAFCFANEELGGVIVGNLDGAHMKTAFGRRMAWAHELCHLLYDRAKMKTLKRFCQMEVQERGPSGPGLDENKLSMDDKIERRARAFGVYFLAPTAAIKSRWQEREGAVGDRVRGLMEEFGVGFEAIRWHLYNLNLLDREAPLRGVPSFCPQQLEASDAVPPQLQSLMDGGVSPLRAGRLAELAREAVAARIIAESRQRELMKVPLHRWEKLRALLPSTPTPAPAPGSLATSSSLIGDWL